ncbi:MAG: double-strand break repair helicase AddA [Pseudomonadota bacterium]
MTVNDATRAQRRAAAPDRSTWLVANAGSGKTRVLTQRVARLLLAGVEPQRILCLTYTKAAASEMQNRLFAQLGEWAMLSHGNLAERLAELGEPGPFPDDVLSAARTLFARAIETPGGLKIQTIHAFCAGVLRRFPVEAGVSPDFREMDDRLSTLMMVEVLEELAQAGDPGFHALIEQSGSDALTDLAAAVIRNKAKFQELRTQDDVWAALGLAPGDDVAALAQECLGPGAASLIDTVARLLAGSSANDQRAAAALKDISLEPPSAASLAALEQVLVYDRKGKTPLTAKHKTFPTKGGRELLGDHLASLTALMDRMEAAVPRRQALATAERSWALHQFATAFLASYGALKAQGGWLDFDDLIERTRALLSISTMAGWVLYKLDGGVDHILVDEAQDTSPAQWDVVRLLAEEFLAGSGSRSDTNRTVFVVGDKKQSIYSFQGADPRVFDKMRDYFSGMLSAADDPLQDASLEFSFRSSPVILELVDQVFADSDHRGLGQDSHHRAFNSALPGRVDVLDPWEPETPEKSEWYEAVDRIGDTDHRRLLAQDVAQRIAGILAGEQVPQVVDGAVKWRRAEPRDILILVQRRSEIFDEIIRACKAAGIPMAGADQLNVAQELAVRDITALLAFLATPEDDLSLAAFLKSPMMGWDERALFELAYHRTQAYLWPALRDRAADFPDTVAFLQDMLGKADFLRPFELIERALTWHGGRRKIRARLGVEAEDAIDALLSQALSYEQSEPPSLTGFLTWLGAQEVKLKRAIDGSANVVRVMTVHGAKGLESPIVIMPDTAPRNAPRSADIADLDGLAIWRPPVRDQPQAVHDGRLAEAELRDEERQRLLYVALTRAESWLIVGAAGKMDRKGDSWFDQIKAAQGRFAPSDIRGGQRIEPMGWAAPDASGVVHAPLAEAPLDLPPVPAPRPQMKPLSPSDLGGAKVMPGTPDDPEALAQGTALHLLLEVLPVLPEAHWAARAEADLGALGLSLLPLARALITAPDLAEVFGPASRAEVPFTAEVAGTRLAGSIDRLIVTDTRVLIVDFKSNALEPGDATEVPLGLLRQMGAYAAAMGQVFPDHQIDVAILWTGSGRLMPLPHSAVIEALQSGLSA